MGLKFDPEEIYQQAIDAIMLHELIFVTDIAAYVPCGRSWLYENVLIEGSERMDTIKDLLEGNKVRIKVEVRQKLRAAQKASELLAIYRLTSTTQEHRLLNQAYMDHTSKGKQIDSAPGVKLTEDQINKVIDKL